MTVTILSLVSFLQLQNQPLSNNWKFFSPFKRKLHDWQPLFKSTIMHKYVLPFQDSDVVAKVWLRFYYSIGRKLAHNLISVSN